MRVLVCGGRDFNDRRLFGEVMMFIFGHPVGDKVNPTWLVHGSPTIIHGAAKGADTLADQWAVTNWLKVESYPADWKTHGKSAGYIRNAKMLEEGRPQLVIAFPGGRGTKMMMELARKAGVAVFDVEKDFKDESWSMVVEGA